jgi:hypothetical protein
MAAENPTLDYTRLQPIARHDASVAEFERAIALNPNYADWRFGWALVPAGDSRRAMDVPEPPRVILS